jgi:hypothetical protein
MARLIILLALIPMGIATKFSHGPGQAWMTAYGGDILYPMFWFHIAIFLFPTLRPLPTAITVFTFSTAVETTQLFDWPILLQLRESFLGRTLVGASFSQTDIFYYALGCALSVAIYKMLNLFFFPSAAAKPRRHNHAFQPSGDSNRPPDAAAAESQGVGQQ